MLIWNNYGFGCCEFIRYCVYFDKLILILDGGIFVFLGRVLFIFYLLGFFRLLVDLND